MKYQRLVLRYEDRVSGSSFSNPTFRVNLNVPYDIPVEVLLEAAYINADIAATKNEGYVRITLKNTAGMNSIVTKNQGFINDGVIGRVGLSDVVGTSFNRYNMDNISGEGGKICFPNQTFKLGRLDLDLSYGDSSNPIIEASTGGGNVNHDNYCIVLGIYCDEDKYN